MWWPGAFHNAGARVRIFYFGDRESAKGDALTNLRIAEKMGLEVDCSRDTSVLEAAVGDSDLVIDALLGTGTKGELKPEAAEVVGAINAFKQGILIAVDIPSGIDADTGVALGQGPDREQDGRSAVRADATITFGFPKIGLVTQPGASYAGDLIVADIGIPKGIDTLRLGANTFLLDSESVVPWPIGPRPRDANKGDFGHVAIVAGSVGMTGAATLAAKGALKTGAGLVTLAVPESLNDIMEVKVTEAMTIPVPQGKARAFGMASLDSVLEMIDKRDAAVIGPGFGRDADTISFALELIERVEKPAIIDADALFAVSTRPEVLKSRKGHIIITPHPGEMARLIGTSAAQVQSNRLDVGQVIREGVRRDRRLEGRGNRHRRA